MEWTGELQNVIAHKIIQELPMYASTIRVINSIGVVKVYIQVEAKSGNGILLTGEVEVSRTDQYVSLMVHSAVGEYKKQHQFTNPTAEGVMLHGQVLQEELQRQLNKAEQGIGDIDKIHNTNQNRIWHWLNLHLMYHKEVKYYEVENRAGEITVRLRQTEVTITAQNMEVRQNGVVVKNIELDTDSNLDNISDILPL